METKTITSIGHTTADGMLRLTVDLGMPDEEVSVIMHVRPIARAALTDEDGWPAGYFDTVPGSMPDLRRMPQGEFEPRESFE